MPTTYKTQIVGYSFEELSEENKQKIYKTEYDDFSHMVDFEPVIDSFKEDMSNQFGADIESLEICYDLSYSQGAGACCTADLDVKTVFDNRVDPHCQLLEFVKVDPELGYTPVQIQSIRIVRCGFQTVYCHENTCRVEIDHSFEGGVPEEAVIESIEEIEEHLTNVIRGELIELYKKLQDHYEASTSFEAYCEIMCNSDSVYTEDGTLVDPVFISGATIIEGVQLALDFDDQNDYSFT